MSNEANGDWVKSRTPRDDDWDEEQSEYGHAVEPVEWDDYANDQSVPVAVPQPRRDPQPPKPSTDVREEAGQPDAPAREATGEQIPEAEPMGLPTSGVVEPTAEAPNFSLGAGDDLPATDPEVGGADPHPAAERPESVDLSDDVRDARRDPDAEPVIDEPILDKPLVQRSADETERAEAAATANDVTGRTWRDRAVASQSIDQPGASEPDREGEPGVGAERPGEAEESTARAADTALVTSTDPAVDRQDVAEREYQKREADPTISTPDDDPNPYQSGWLDDATDDREPPRPSTEPATEPVAEPREVIAEPREVIEEPREEPVAEQPADAEPVKAEEPRPYRDPAYRAEERHGEPVSFYDEPTDDIEATQAVPVVDESTAAATALAAGSMSGLYRDEVSDTAVLSEDRRRILEEQEAEERRFQEQLEAERRARQERLGVVATSSDNELREPDARPAPTTDKFFPSLGLLLLRLVTAGVLGITAYEILTDIPGTEAILATTVVPEPRLAAWILGFTLGGMAVFLVLGLLQRLVGLLLLAYGVGMLAVLKWGRFNPFLETFQGFHGDKELLLAGIGMLLLSVGGGRAGIDAAFRRGRARAKAERNL